MQLNIPLYSNIEHQAKPQCALSAKRFSLGQVRIAMAGKLISCKSVTEKCWFSRLEGEKQKTVFFLRYSTHQNGKVEAMRKKIAQFYQRNI